MFHPKVAGSICFVIGFVVKDLIDLSARTVNMLKNPTPKYIEAVFIDHMFH
jgi:hypothetical protein